MTKTKNKDVVYFLFGAIVLMVMLGTVAPVLDVLALLLAVYVIMQYDDTASLTMLFLLLPFASVFKVLAVTGTSFITVLEGVYLVKLLAKSERISIYQIFFLGVLGVLLIIDATDYMYYIKLMVALALLSLLIEKEFDYKPIILAFSIGILLSSAMALFFFNTLHIANYIEQIKEMVGTAYAVRFTGLYSDPNFFTINIILCMTGLIMCNAFDRINELTFFALTIPMIIFGALTGSKSFLIMLVVCVLFYLWFLLKRHKYIQFLFALLLLIWAVMSVINGRIVVFDEVLSRLTDASNLSELTTTRTDIWQKYSNYFRENPVRLTFGNGIGAKMLRERAPHNTYIDILYNLGITRGVVFVLYLLVLFVKNTDARRNRGLLQYMPLIMLLTMYFFLSALFQYDFAFQLLLAAILLNVKAPSAPGGALSPLGLSAKSKQGKERCEIR